MLETQPLTAQLGGSHAVYAAVDAYFGGDVAETFHSAEACLKRGALCAAARHAALAAGQCTRGATRAHAEGRPQRTSLAAPRTLVVRTPGGKTPGTHAESRPQRTAPTTSHARTRVWLVTTAIMAMLVIWLSLLGVRHPAAHSSLALPAQGAARLADATAGHSSSSSSSGFGLHAALTAPPVSAAPKATQPESRQQRAAPTASPPRAGAMRVTNAVVAMLAVCLVLLSVRRPAARRSATRGARRAHRMRGTQRNWLTPRWGASAAAITTPVTCYADMRAPHGS
jgi:hypothetical protein